jgi:ribonuclease Z
MLSSWFWHAPSRTLLDCGEGVSLYMRNYVYGIERVLITHSHADHVNGLISLIGFRNSGRGDKEKPLDVYYPVGDKDMIALIEFIQNKFKGWLTYKLNFVGVLPGYKIPLDSNHWIEVFELQHSRKRTLGYKILEGRSRLKPEYVGKNIPELIANGIDKNNLNEAYNQITLAYCLDAFSLRQSDVKDASVAIMDCTFLSVKDRDDNTHFALEESVQFCKDAGIKRMIAAHFSPRYSQKEIDVALLKYNVEGIRINQLNEI